MSIDLSPGRVCERGTWGLLSEGREVTKVQGLGLELGKTDNKEQWEVLGVRAKACSHGRGLAGEGSLQIGRVLTRKELRIFAHVSPLLDASPDPLPLIPCSKLHDL